MKVMLGFALALAIAACGGSQSSDTTAAAISADESLTTSSDTTIIATTSAPVGDSGGEVREDVPPACELAPAAEVSDLAGIELTGDETMGGECSYEAADEFSLFLTAGAFPLPAEECATWLPSEPLFEEETVEPAPEFGDHASIITAELRTDYFVCANGAALSVEMIGPETMPPDEQKSVAAGVMELMLGRL